MFKATLQLFLGVISFYNHFLERRATIANDLYQLLTKNVRGDGKQSMAQLSNSSNSLWCKKLCWLIAFHRNR